MPNAPRRYTPQAFGGRIHYAPGASSWDIYNQDRDILQSWAKRQRESGANPIALQDELQMATEWIGNRQRENQRREEQRFWSGPLGLARNNTADLYLQQHFPKYASGGGVNIGQNIYAPRIGSRSRGGRGYYGGYGGEMPEGYYPRVVARGAMPAPAIYPGMGPGTVMAPQTDWTGPKTVEEIQADQWAAREAAGVTNLATPAYGMQPTSRGYMWIGGPEGDKAIAAAKDTDALMEELGYY